MNEKQLNNKVALLQTKLSDFQKRQRNFNNQAEAEKRALSECKNGSRGDACRSQKQANYDALKARADELNDPIANLQTQLNDYQSIQQEIERDKILGDYKPKTDENSFDLDHRPPTPYEQPPESIEDPNAKSSPGWVNDYNSVMNGLNGFVGGVGDVMETGFTLNHEVDTSEKNKTTAIMLAVLGGIVAVFFLMFNNNNRRYARR